tara:strand:+ start:1878 stop:2945 length:1068 start_codon:yes stop_codon:yes gene_type:complete
MLPHWLFGPGLFDPVCRQAMKHRLLLLLSLMFMANSSSALNILLTNDDGWDTENIRVLKIELDAAGHDVIMSTPCTQQSGKGGALTVLKHLPVNTSRSSRGEYCLGDVDASKSYAEYADGTPVMSALYGIDVLAPRKWEGAPDLVISGPNTGNNLGMVNNNSGTLGAALVAISRGIPAIAVSANTMSLIDKTQAPIIADVTLNILAQLEASRSPSAPLLPPLTGLNINFPKEIKSHKGIKFTQVGWESAFALGFSTDLSKEKRIMVLAAARILDSGKVKSWDEAMKVAESRYSGKNGLTFVTSGADDVDPLSEGNAVHEGYITISTFDGSIQAASEKSLATQRRLSSLQKQMKSK